MFYDNLCHVLPGSHYTLPVMRYTLELIFVTNTGHYLDVEYWTLLGCYNDLCHDIAEILYIMTYVMSTSWTLIMS